MLADLQATGQCKQTDGSRSTSYRPVTKDKRSWAFASHQWPKVNKMVEDGGPGQPKVQVWYVRVRKLPHNAPRTPSSMVIPYERNINEMTYNENLPDGWKVDIIPDGWKEEQLAEGCKDVKGQQRNVKCELVKLLMLISMGTIVLFNDKQHSYMKDGKKVWILLTDGSADSGWRS